MTNDDVSRRTKVFRFWALAWFALGIGMAVSMSMVPLMVMFAIGHFGLYPVVLYYAIKLSNEIWKEEEKEEEGQHKVNCVENVHGITSVIEELVQMTCSMCRDKSCNGKGDCSGIVNARKALAELKGEER